jgi:polyhydroxyalkanoate synthesis regulator phasin
MPLIDFLMDNPLVHAFFIGRALAESIAQQAEVTLSDALSDLGKFDAEQRERLRQFTDQVLEKARQAEEAAMQGRPASTATTSSGGASSDLQTMIDELRAEIAELRTELQRYRNRTL